MNRYAQPGWTDRYGPLLRELAGYAWIVFCIVFIFYGITRP